MLLPKASSAISNQQQQQQQQQMAIDDVSDFLHAEEKFYLLLFFNIDWRTKLLGIIKRFK